MKTRLFFFLICFHLPLTSFAVEWKEGWDLKTAFYSHHLGRAVVEITDPEAQKLNYAECRLNATEGELLPADLSHSLSECEWLSKEWISTAPETLVLLQGEFKYLVSLRVKDEQHTREEEVMLGALGFSLGFPGTVIFALENASRLPLYGPLHPVMGLASAGLLLSGLFAVFEGGKHIYPPLEDRLNKISPRLEHQVKRRFVDWAYTLYKEELVQALNNVTTGHELSLGKD